MKKVIILKGLPASGKSAWAKERIAKNPGMYKCINKDNLRAMLDCGKWSKDNEKMILAVRDAIILEALDRGKHVIVDDTNFAPKHEVRIRQLVRGHAEVEIKIFNVSVDECIKRDLERENSVGAKVIQGMYNQFLKPEEDIYVPPVDKPTAYIFDIDGTLAKMNNRGAYDWNKVHTDICNESVRDMLWQLQNGGHKIIIFTGRDAICREATEKWLFDYGIEYDHFDIRPENNTEKDVIIKKRMFDKIKNDYRILGVFDDRKQVKRMWVNLGLFVFDCNQTDEEF